MGAENFVNASAGSKRSAKRARVLLSAKLKTPSGEIAARLRDLSRKGALVECEQAPAKGSEVVFVRGGTSVAARVAWSSNNRVGLEFEHMIDDHELLVHIGKPSVSAPLPQHYRRTSLGKGMSAADRRVAQAWSVAVGLNIPESDS
jgi:hypothetical protein